MTRQDTFSNGRKEKQDPATCRHSWRFDCHLDADVYSATVWRCNRCGLMETFRAPRTYLGYSLCDEHPTRGRYEQRLREEGLEEPKEVQS